MAKNSGVVHTLCWNCANTNGNLCSWFAADAKPVEGWVAEETQLKVRNNRENRIIQSFVVHSCPNFKQMREAS